MHDCVFWINAFQICSENFGLLPREIVPGLTIYYERDCKIDPGSHVEASTNAMVTNDNAEWTKNCVAVIPIQETSKAQLSVLVLRRERYFTVAP